MYLHFTGHFLFFFFLYILRVQKENAGTEYHQIPRTYFPVVLSFSIYRNLMKLFTWYFFSFKTMRRTPSNVFYKMYLQMHDVGIFVLKWNNLLRTKQTIRYYIFCAIVKKSGIKRLIIIKLCQQRISYEVLCIMKKKKTESLKYIFRYETTLIHFYTIIFHTLSTFILNSSNVMSVYTPL